MVKVGFAEEFGLELPGDVRWVVRNKEDIRGYIARYDEDFAELFNEKFKDLKVRVTSVEDKVVIDTKDVLGDYIVVETGKHYGRASRTEAPKEKRKIRKGVSEKILEYLREYKKNHEEFTIGEFYDWLKDKLKVHRPQVYNVVVKSGLVKYEYKEIVGKKGKVRKVIVIKDVSP